MKAEDAMYQVEFIISAFIKLKVDFRQALFPTGRTKVAIDEENPIGRVSSSTAHFYL